MDSNPHSVLIVDDDAAVAETLAANLEQWDPRPDELDPKRFEAAFVLSGEKALAYLAEGFADVVIADLRMPGMDGLELLQRIQHDLPGTPVVMLTAHASIPLAVEAMRRGAHDFVEKPWNLEELVASLKRAINAAPPERRDARAREPRTHEVLARLPTMEKALEAVRRAAGGMATVLIRGESGTGKNVAARMLHDLGPRKAAPFITVHCAGIPDDLLESELFGHEPGSFTGAGPKRKDGRLTWAEGGTLFLDEIGDVPLKLQVKLLELLGKERHYTRLGGDKELTADVRVVAATHRDLEKMTREGTFREDLYFRLNVIPVWIPPLRERRAEIEQLAHRFLERFSAENGREGLRYSDAALEALRSFHWPGNIRQLENVVERLAVMSTGETISLEEVREALSGAPSEPLIAGHDREVGRSLAANMKATEKRFLVQTLTETRGNKALAARFLEISRRSLYYKLQEHGLVRWKAPDDSS